MLITVSQDGRHADFKRLQEAIDSIEAGGRRTGKQQNQHCSIAGSPVERCKLKEGSR